MSEKVVRTKVIAKSYGFGEYLDTGSRLDPVFCEGDEVVVILTSEYERLKSYADMYIEQGG